MRAQGVCVFKRISVLTDSAKKKNHIESHPNLHADALQVGSLD